MLSSRRSFAGWMFTDSKYFLLNNTSSKKGLKVYYLQGERPTRSALHQSRGVHFCLGVTKFGATEPILPLGVEARLLGMPKPMARVCILVCV